MVYKKKSKKSKKSKKKIGGVENNNTNNECLIDIDSKDFDLHYDTDLMSEITYKNINISLKNKLKSLVLLACDATSSEFKDSTDNNTYYICYKCNKEKQQYNNIYYWQNYKFKYYKKKTNESDIDQKVELNILVKKFIGIKDRNTNKIIPVGDGVENYYIKSTDIKNFLSNITDEALLIKIFSELKTGINLIHYEYALLLLNNELIKDGYIGKIRVMDLINSITPEKVKQEFDNYKSRFTETQWQLGNIGKAFNGMFFG